MSEKNKPATAEPTGSRLWVGPLSWLVACIIAFVSFWLGGFLRDAQVNIYTVLLYGFLFFAIASLSALPALIVVWIIKFLRLPRGWSETFAGAAIGPLAYLYSTMGDFSAARTDTTPEDIARSFVALALIGALAGFSYWLVQWLINRRLDKRHLYER
jgi:hypothetical protein